ncbi:response regulator transcription factor [Fodinicola feengrottensis]|nr:response regulator transcription factor [Fodinicola feengrottensis]
MDLLTATAVRSIRVLIAEDMNLIRGALVALLTYEDGIEVVSDVGRGDEIVPAAVRSRPDVAVLDIGLPGLDGISAAAELTSRLPDCRVLMLTAIGSPATVRQALAVPVRGLLAKDAPAEQLANSIRRVHEGEFVLDPELVGAALEHGESPLTIREATLLQEVASGAPMVEIGTRLRLSSGTVRNYLSNVIAKLGARNRLDAIRIAREAGWI